MTPEEIRTEADDAARAFAKLVSQDTRSTGIPKPVEIVVTQTETDVEKFGLQLNPKSTSAAPSAQGQQGPPPPPACNPCDPRHLSIRFRCAGEIQTDGCFPNSGLLSWDCGFAFTSLEVDILPCATTSTFSHNFTLDWSDSRCTDWESCGGGGDPTVCAWHAGVTLSLIGGHTLRSSYASNTYSASVATTRLCDGFPTVVDAVYDSGVQGFPPLPTDIVVPDWCAAVGTNLFGYNGFWSQYYAQGGCNCFGGPKNVSLGFGLYFYIDVT